MMVYLILRVLGSHYRAICGYTMPLDLTKKGMVATSGLVILTLNVSDKAAVTEIRVGHRSAYVGLEQCS